MGKKEEKIELFPLIESVFNNEALQKIYGQYRRINDIPPRDFLTFFIRGINCISTKGYRFLGLIQNMNDRKDFLAFEKTPKKYWYEIEIGNLKATQKLHCAIYLFNTGNDYYYFIADEVNQKHIDYFKEEDKPPLIIGDETDHFKEWLKNKKEEKKKK